MLAAERSRGTCDGEPRVLVDVTTSLMLAGSPPVGISRVEGEIARRLLLSTDIRPIPVVFRYDDGLLFALNPEQVARIFLAEPIAAAEGPPPRAPDSSSVEAAAESPPRPLAVEPRRTLAVELRLRVTAGLRRTARASVEYMPNALREDMRAILIHARQIVRTIFYSGRGSVPVPSGRGSVPVPSGRGSVPVPVGSVPIPIGSVPVPISAQPNYVAALRDQILPTLRMVVYPRPGDVLWTAGLYSNFVPLRTIAEMRVRTGLRVVTTCYDLIRVMHPQFNAAAMGAELFTADTVALLDASDLVLAISESTRRDLQDFAARLGRGVPATQVIRLGSNLAMRDTRSEHQDGASLPLDLGRRCFALAVGTVEPRKNYGLLLRIWERLAADPSFPLDLVIVGRRGFGAEDSILEIERSPLFGSRILWLESCPDETLRRLYDACHLVLYPSFVEGWGLPIVEALSLGRHVIASDRGAMIEASQGYGQLLDPEDEDAWTEAIAAASTAPRIEVILPDPPDWDITAAMVDKHLRRLLAKCVES
jgi:hypothetical protein